MDQTQVCLQLDSRRKQNKQTDSYPTYVTNKDTKRKHKQSKWNIAECRQGTINGIKAEILYSLFSAGKYRRNE